MPKNGCSIYFLTIFPKNIGINSEWPKMGILNFFQHILEWPKMAILNFSNNFSQKDWYKFGMAKNGHSEFFDNLFGTKRLV